MFSILLLCSLFCLCSLSQAAGDTDLDLGLNGNSPDFKIFVDGETWFQSGQLGVRHNDVWWSSENTENYVLKVASYDTTGGEDFMGSFVKHRFLWNGHSSARSSSVDLKIETAIVEYDDAPAIIFDIVYLTGLTNSNPQTDAKMPGGVLSSFPSFVLDAEERKKGWMTWSTSMTSDIRFGLWQTGESIYSSIEGGFPLAVFDSTMKAAVVISPFNSFMAAMQASINSTAKKNETHVAFGLLPSITNVPAGYKYSSIMVAAGNITSAMRRFGEILRREYKKEDHYRKSDYSINYLGYWTDNGACYHYYSGDTYSNYEEILVAAKEDADSKGIPFRYMQLDSWWYFKGKNDGVKNWTAMPDIFPNGIASVVDKTGWPVVAHNRFWSTDTDYAQKFNFIIEEHGALPNDTSFWDYLISSTLHSFNMIVYEQDWLSTQVDNVKALQTDLFLGEQWLVGMGAAAERHGLTVQYCMPWPRHVLQSVMIPAVTQTRVSGDYQPGNNQWIVGDSSILAHAVGLAPFKDNFRTTSNQPDCSSRYHTNETTPMLEIYVATMTGGPVGSGDMVGTSNVTLINTTCMQDGRLLKPTHPAMSLDSTFLRRAFGEMGPMGNMTAAYTEIDGLTWYYILGADLDADYALSAAELPPSRGTFPASKLHGVVFQYNVISGEPFDIEELTEDNTITVEKCGKEDFKYFVIAPLLRNGMAVFGELSKFVTVSEVRFTSVDVTDDGGVATLVGVPSEKVTVTVYTGKTTVAVECVIGSSGYAELTISQTPSCV